MHFLIKKCPIVCSCVCAALSWQDVCFGCACCTVGSLKIGSLDFGCFEVIILNFFISRFVYILICYFIKKKN